MVRYMTVHRSTYLPSKLTSTNMQSAPNTAQFSAAYLVDGDSGQAFEWVRRLARLIRWPRRREPVAARGPTFTSAPPAASPTHD